MTRPPDSAVLTAPPGCVAPVETQPVFPAPPRGSHSLTSYAPLSALAGNSSMHAIPLPSRRKIQPFLR